MTLYEISADIRKMLQEGFVCDEETGELLFDGSEGLQALQMAREQKVLAIAKVMKETQNELEAFEVERKALAKRMIARAAAMERKIEWLQRCLQQNVAEGEKLNDGIIALSWRKTTSVEIAVAVESLPDAFVKIAVTRTADKTALKAALQGGAAVAGVCLVEKVSPVLK